jgi:hypothetical protein
MVEQDTSRCGIEAGQARRAGRDDDLPAAQLEEHGRLVLDGVIARSPPPRPGGEVESRRK